MAPTGRPRKANPVHIKKSPRDYARRRRELIKSGFTERKFAPTTNNLAVSVAAKWVRFCATIKKDPHLLLAHLVAADVKLFFEWLEENFRYSIKSHRSLGTYWRTFKRIYVKENKREMPKTMQLDCVNYMNEVSEKWNNGEGLYRLHKPKPTAQEADLLMFHMANLVKCNSVFPTEKQRFGLFCSLNLAAATASRAVSFFDTRPKTVTYSLDELMDTLMDNHHDDDLSLERTSGHRSTPFDSSEEDSDLTDEAIDTDLTDYEEVTTSMDETVLHDDNDLGYNSDSDATEDGFLDGDEATRTLLWRHIDFRVIRNPDSSKTRNVAVAIVSLLHTKGEDSKPRLKRWIIEHEDHPLFDTLGQLLSMAKHDNAFAADIRDLEDIYHYQIPPKGYLELKIKKDMLDQPVFRIGDMPLDANTYARWLGRIGDLIGLKQNLTHKVLRRTAIKILNKYAPASVRDQAADHDSKSNTIPYYLDQIVDCDVMGHLLNRECDSKVRAVVTQLKMLADSDVPMGLTDRQEELLKNHPEILKQRQVCLELKASLRRRGYKSDKEALGTTIYTQRKNAVAELNRLRTQLRREYILKNKKRHFRRGDTNRINEQYVNGQLTKTANRKEPENHNIRSYLIPERAEFIAIVRNYNPDATEDEKHELHIRCMRLWTQWQDRRERPRRGRLASAPQSRQAISQPLTDSLDGRYHKLQCPLCVVADGVTETDRLRPFSKTNKLWDHVEKIHEKELAAFDYGGQSCKICERRLGVMTVLSNTSDYMAHTKRKHGIPLRPRPIVATMAVESENRIAS